MGKQVGFTQGELDVEVVCVVGWVRQVIRFCPLLSARAIASYYLACCVLELKVAVIWHGRSVAVGRAVTAGGMVNRYNGYGTVDERCHRIGIHTSAEPWIRFCASRHCRGFFLPCTPHHALNNCFVEVAASLTHSARDLVCVIEKYMK